jgi:hypothetical protein
MLIDRQTDITKAHKRLKTQTYSCALIFDFQNIYIYFVAVVGLVWSNNPESYAGGSVTTIRASHARQVKGDDPDKKGYPGPPGWGLGVGLTTPSHKKMFC